MILIVPAVEATAGANLIYVKNPQDNYCYSYHKTEND